MVDDVNIIHRLVSFRRKPENVMLNLIQDLIKQWGGHPKLVSGSHEILNRRSA